MQSNLPKHVLICIIVVLIGVVGFLSWFVYNYYTTNQEESEPVVETVTEEPVVEVTESRIVGYSVEGRPIEAYTLGTGPNNVLVFGGIHGGYEWNSIVLAYELLDHFDANRIDIPDSVTLTIVPNANPDGLFTVFGLEGRFSLADIPFDADGVVPLDTTVGRFNVNGVDLNRNFGCKWQPESTWRGQTVSAGTEAFSEPEAQAIRDLAIALQPQVAIFLHSKANAVFASECHAGVLPETLAFTNAYAAAANYTPVEVFDDYEVTGDVEGWLATLNVPAITVELKTHETVEFTQNLAGLQAVLQFFE